jgi:2-polyprenyl-3-methyl-5-hydroxy-6-metoxy-1,4-benzoquinol methylase
MPEGASWSRRYRHRREFERRHPSVFSFPLARNPSEVLFRHIRDGMRVLDVGSGPGKAGERIRSRFPSVEVRTVDVDPEAGADHRTIDDARGPFDRVVLFEVLEHLDLEESVRLLRGIRERLAEGGLLLATTPNVFHPSAFLRDATHRTPLSYGELAGLAASCGFEVREVRRIHNAPWAWRVLRRTIAEPLHRLLGIDYARSVMLVAGVAADDGSQR